MEVRRSLRAEKGSTEGGVLNQIYNLYHVGLGHRLHHVIELGLLGRHPLNPELGFYLGEPNIDVVRPERRKLHGDGLAVVGGVLLLIEGRIADRGVVVRHTVKLVNLCTVMACGKNSEAGSRFRGVLVK